MDRQLLERLIGAGVLVVALVIVVPAILDGDSDGDVDREPDASATVNEPRRTHTIRLDQSAERPPVAREREPVKPSAVTSPKPAGAIVSQPVMPEAPAPVSPKPDAKASPESSSAPEPLSVEPVSVRETGWVVQLGSFSSKQNARRLADEISRHDFSVFLTPLDRSGKILYRVRVGPRDTRAQAAELAGRLAKLGYSGQVTQ